MYSPLQLGFKYLSYRISAANGKGHGIHSPFVYKLVREVLNDQTFYPDYTTVEALRKQLKQDPRILEVEDFGAGSVKGHSRNRKVSAIAKTSLKPAKYGQLLYRLVRYFQPQTLLELGTSLGITTGYLAAANPQARLITMEGAEQIAAVARAQFQQLKLATIEQVTGNFDTTLPAFLEELKESLDFVFVDGNHQYEPTVRYFLQLLPHLHTGSVLVFDDIHWSAPMEEAWKEICAHESVRLSIDLFFIGLVFFRDEQKEKQHFTIRF
jgi:predicted O-methyltransferase YrrM